MEHVKARNMVVRHVQSSGRIYYVDLGPLLSGSIVVSSATVMSTDATLTLGAVTVLSSDTTLVSPIEPYPTHVIEAHTGCHFTISGGTSPDEGFVTMLATFSDGQKEAVDLGLKTEGEPA